MDSTSSLTASSRVFDIPELLQHILVQLIEPNGRNRSIQNAQTRTLFRLQAVNTSFRDTIRRSKALRFAMYLDSSDASTASKPQLGLINPILGWLQDHHTAFRPTWFAGCNGNLYEVLLEPRYIVEQGLTAQVLKLECDFDTGVEDEEGEEDLLLLQHIRELRAAMRKGSWRAALVNNTSHAVKFELELTLHKTCGCRTQYILKELPAESTLGDMMAWILGELEKVWNELEAQKT